jgi:hypothetical protein
MEERPVRVPEPPENVRVVTHDGQEWPVEVYYRGIEEGQHVWVATTTYHGLPKAIAADRVPPHTAISVEFTP